MTTNRDHEGLESLKSEGSRPSAEAHVKKKFWTYFKRHQSDASFFRKLEVMYEWVLQGKMRGSDKAILLGALLYFINPLDMMPDFTPLLGFLDDVGVVGLAFRYLSNRALESENSNRDDAG